MPITIGFNYAINESVAIGDTAYYINTSTSGSPTPYGAQGDIVEIGEITGINRDNTDPTANTITCNIGATTTRPSTNSFILFSKDNRTNMSSLAGYYAEVKMENNSNQQIELFSVGSEIVESSK